MNPEQWARVKDVFNAALEQEAGARARIRCRGEPRAMTSVRSEVERLLDAQRRVR